MKDNKCPYPGLRPFTEKESIYFKGRDLHIKQIINQLQARKIVIVTGASGDGKSSLIYAGVIPNARAGFFNAQFNNWVIADFRPERSPLENLAKSLSEQLSVNYQDTYTELKFGFSALVNVYKRSQAYIDMQSQEWKDADDSKKDELKKKAANLLILADQFEEFFTNAENYSNGKPSSEAYTTVNLLLETARISLEEKLPIFIVFTMRSDYISDCVAFKGLPEYIGFSQFFVPRLKRNELQQVIEEPARLAGGKVSHRLVEVLINDLRSGFDQLPVLQHALNRLWKLADNGNETLDLIHLAKLGGIDAAFLSKDEEQIFLDWKNNLDETEKKYFENPEISNILNSHANRLYEKAFDYFMQNADWAEKNIDENDAKHIIKVAFLSLTKIDDGRAVRSRMSIREITNIIDKPHIKAETVCGVLNIFREPDSTFIRPFIDPNDIETRYLSADTVLDITHEALIRNWVMLKEWEREEEENLNDFLEFKTQLQRWVDSNKSKEFLLPLGPLSHFENWYNRCQPNKYWIAKYQESENLEPADKLAEAEIISANTVEYLDSSRKHIIATERKKRRLRNTAIISALLVIFMLTVVALWALREKQNAELQRQYAEEQKILAEKKRNEAIEANKKAEEARRKAELEAKKALLAKQQSDSARRLAEILRVEAEKQRNEAERQAEIARQEKEKSDSLLGVAMKQTEKARKANERATKLSNLSLAQTLAYKATDKYEDVQYNLVLAYVAYKLHEDNGGKPNDPVIFNGLRKANSLAINEADNVSLDNDVRAFYPYDHDKIIYITLLGDIKIKNISKNTSIDFGMLKNFKFSVEVDYAWFLNKDYLVAHGLDRKLYIIDLENKKATKLREKDKTDYVQMHPTGSSFVTATSNGDITFWQINDDDKYIASEIKSFNIGQQIKSIKFDPFGSFLIIGTKSGNVLSINLETENVMEIVENNLKGAITAIAFSNDGKIFVTGTELGNIFVYYRTNSGFKLKNTLSVGQATVKKIVLDKEAKSMIVVGPDKVINVYMLDKLNDRPIVINPQKGKILDVFIEQQQLYCVYNTNINSTFISFNTDPDKYAETVKEHIKRKLTKEEWWYLVGEQQQNIDLNEYLDFDKID